MFEITILNIITNLTQYEFNTLMHLVSKEKQDRISKFHFLRDAQNCLLGDVLTRIEICRRTDLINKQLEFSTNEYGKPFLINDPHIHFNISHAGNCVAFAIADVPVGIDIEIIKPIDLKIAERFFTPDEIEYILSGDQIQRFYEVWTKKESYIKYDGKGLRTPLPSFSVFEPCEQRIAYQGVFQNVESICHVCSKKKRNPTIDIMDTVAFLKSII